MLLSKRVVVTGLGTVSPLGEDTSSTWEKATQGHLGISKISKINTENLPVCVAGEVRNFSLPEDILSKKDQAHYDTFNLYGLKASLEAYHQAGNPKDVYPKTRQGVILGVGIGGLPFIYQNSKIFLERGHRRVSPFFIPGCIPNMVSGLISEILDLQGVSFVTTSACTSSAHAITSAFHYIASGQQDLMVTGGAESVITEMAISGFGAMRALSTEVDPTKASRPFDKARNGFVLSEGAAILVLEEFESAKKRGVPIFAEIIGVGSSSDAHHMSRPHPEGRGALHSMINALKMAQVESNKIDYINAHATSTPLGDKAEILAIKKLLQDHAKSVSISSTKSMTGHLLGAAGGIESIFCIKAINDGIVPPTINLHEPDEEFDIDLTPMKSKKKDVKIALNNSFGFGGANCSLIFSSVT